MKLWPAGAILLLCALLPGSSLADDLSNPSMPVDPDSATTGRGVVGARLDVRSFGSDEDLTYAGFSLSAGFGKQSAGILRGMFAEKRSLALPGGGTIRHGGNDLEILLRVTAAKGRYDWAGQLGLSFADTPAQKDTFFTLDGKLRAEIGKGMVGFFHPRAAFIKDNELIGLGLGAEGRLANNLWLVGEWTVMASGDNTRNTTTGALQQRDLFLAALRFTTQDGRTRIDLGFTNATGGTTGFGLTPGLGGSGALYLAIGYRH